MRQIVRLLRPGFAAVAILAFAAATVAATTISPGAGGSPGLEIGGNVAIVTTVVHDSSHQVVTSVPLGTTIHPAVTVSGASGTPGGTVNVTFWTNGTCSGSGLIVAVAALVSGGFDGTNTDYPTTTLGALSYRTKYLGDGVYPAATSACASVTITKVDPSVLLSIHDPAHNPVTSIKVGMFVHAFVDVNGRPGTPTGTVRVYRWNGSSCSGAGSVVGPYTLAGGELDTEYYWQMSTLGTYAFRATYSGDGTFNPGFSTCVVVNVVKWPVDFVTQMYDQYNHAVDAAYVGDQLHVRATLSASQTPTGTVVFRHYPAGDCDGAADKTANIPADSVMDPAGPVLLSLKPGVESWQLEYLGDAKFAAAVGPCMTLRIKGGPDVNVVIHDASHATVTTLNTGQTAHPRVTVTGPFDMPTGTVTVTWYANVDCVGSGTTLGTRTLSNGVVDTAALAFTPTKAGTYSFDATYSGNASYIADASPCVALTVLAAPVGTPKPTIAAPKPTSSPAATQVAAAATAAPNATDAPTATDQPAASSAPNATSAVDAATDAPSASAAPAATDAASAGTGAGSGAAGPSTPSGNGGTGWILLLLLLFLIAAFVIWAARRSAGQRRRSAEATR